MHHAYIYEGSLALLPALVADARERFGFDKHPSTTLGAGNPDVHVREFEKFGIDESRWLTDVGALKSASGKALFILGISSITSEAQQALLKLFEEPQQGSIFVLLVPHGSLLPTLRSRMLEYPEELRGELRSNLFKKSSGRPSDGDIHQTILPSLPTKFLSSSAKERSDIITKLLKDEDGVKERVRGFVNALEVEVHAQFSKARSDLALREGLQDIATVRNYLADRSPSLKMLLEHLALSLPQV